MHHARFNICHIGVFATLAYIASVEEGQNLTVCIELVCSQATLEYALEFEVDVSNSTKTGWFTHSFVKGVAKLVMHWTSIHNT